MKIKLQDHGYPWMVIINGRERVGRTYRVGNTFSCVIGKEVVHAGAKSHEEAFREGAARWLGHSSAAALATHNAAVNARNAEARVKMNDMVRQYMNASPEERAAALDKIFRRLES